MLKDPSNTEPNVTDRADVAIVLGDLNFRVNSNKTMMIHLLEQEMYDVILMNDQLLQAKKAERTMVGLEEGTIEFAPTYRYFPGTDNFNMKDGRIMSYTDRILFRSSEPNFLRLVSYDSKIGRA